MLGEHGRVCWESIFFFTRPKHTKVQLVELPALSRAVVIAQAVHHEKQNIYSYTEGWDDKGVRRERKFVCLFVCLALFRARGAHCAPLPPGKLSKISQERLSLQIWNFLKISLNWFSKLTFGFQQLPPTLAYHSNAHSWRMFLNIVFQQFSSKSSPELERDLLFPWRVS